MDEKIERFVRGVGILAIMLPIIWLVSLIGDSQPSVRWLCKLHPSSEYVITGVDEAGEHVAWCKPIPVSGN